ncbi:MAG: hypothetical protein ACFB2X_19980 [Rivularia sp. (in: cyanobacteria)]
MLLTANEAQLIALEFLINEWNIANEYRDWFTVIDCRLIGQSWYIVEVAVAGFPDRWYLQVYDTGECDPNYTFISPIRGCEGYTDLTEIPELVAEVLVCERNSR